MNKTKFKEDLVRLGLKEGDTVMMHAAFKSLGGSVSPEDLFAGLLEVLGEEGTLVLPAFSYRTVNYDNPIFDLATTPSCVGFLPEFFRTQIPGVRRSLHATHSCCVIGKHADVLIQNHELDLTPVGENSPIAKLPTLDGKILFLGAHPDHNTALHGVEEKAGVPYVLDREKRVHYCLIDGERQIHQQAFRHYFHRPDYDYEQRYARILSLLSKEEFSHGFVLSAECYLMSAREVLEKGLSKSKEDPYFFVDRIPVQ